MRYVGEHMVERYSYGSYIIEVEELDEVIYAWIYHKHCSVKMLMFGLPIQQEYKRFTKDEILQIIDANIPSYVEYYREENET